MSRNIQNVVDDLNALVSSIGLEKLAEGVKADPGTSQPAEQEAGRSNIQPATEGAHASENSAAVKEDVTGQSIDESAPAAAEGGEMAESATENITTATTVGEDPAVEKDYGTSSQAGNYPGTSHPADTSSNDKYASVKEAAEAILAELENQKTAEEKKAEYSEKSAVEQLGSAITNMDDEDGLNKTAEEITEVGTSATSEFLTGYVKTAGLIGELAADYLDGLQIGMNKKAEGMVADELPAPMPLEEGAPEEEGMVEGAPEEEGMVEGAPEEGMDEAAEALVEEAIMVAEELGVEPEDVLEAALSEGGEEEMGVEDAAPVSEEELMEGVADEAADAEVAGEGMEEEPMEVMASVHHNYMMKQAAAGNFDNEYYHMLKEAGRAGDAIKYLREGASKAKGYVGNKAKAVGEAAGKAKDYVKNTAGKAKDTAGKAKDYVKGKAKGAVNAVDDKTLQVGKVRRATSEGGKATAKSNLKQRAGLAAGGAAVGGAGVGAAMSGDKEKKSEVDAELAEKAAAYDKMMAEKEAQDAQAASDEHITNVVKSAMDGWWAKKSAEQADQK